MESYVKLNLTTTVLEVSEKNMENWVILFQYLYQRLLGSCNADLVCK